ncbi:ubiquinone biosynthesis accessory factor UbiJ [Psychrobacter aquaticus]|uniref:YigP Protein n=1 Tax=Psychrobacter aquaticus CMS 56 TaxID=1354303 RepID=U4T4N5_9GAMM|nr:YigP protein [Psychrobacter aquaticus]ERL56332.1 YigP Protein [Psychrobacter aquaticus CMS 56]
MLTVLLLAGAEKLINFAIASDEITKAGLAPLAGKVLRLNMAMPELNLDILFTHERLRFEPVTTDSVFEPSGHMDERQKASMERSRIGHSRPDCVITVDNPAQLLNLIRGAEGNLPIAGDYKVLMQLKQLVAGFDPDVAGQLEPLIGKPMASQLHLLILQLKGSWRYSAKRAFDDVSDWANDVTGNSVPDPVDAAEVNDLKQQLLKLRTDIEREEARLAAIKDEQARLINNR